MKSFEKTFSQLAVFALVSTLPIIGHAQNEKNLIAADATLQKLASDFAFTEGPAPDNAGNVYFTDQPNNRIWKWGIDGQLSKFLEPAGRANGLCFDAQNRLWACAMRRTNCGALT